MTARYFAHQVGIIVITPFPLLLHPNSAIITPPLPLGTSPLVARYATQQREAVSPEHTGSLRN